MGLLRKAAKADTGRGLLARISKTTVHSKPRGVLKKTLAAAAFPLSGLVFEADESAGNAAERVSYLVSDFASVCELGDGRCLIAGSLDCDLLAHRLSAAVRGKKLLTFTCGDPDEALRLLEPYL